MASTPNTPDLESDSEIFIRPGNVEVEPRRHPLDFEGQRFDREMSLRRESHPSLRDVGHSTATTIYKPSLVCFPRESGELLSYNPLLPRRYFPTDEEVDRIRRNLFNTDREVDRIMSLPNSIRNRSLSREPMISTHVTPITRTRSETVTISSCSKPIVVVCECNRVSQVMSRDETITRSESLTRGDEYAGQPLWETYHSLPLQLSRPNVTMQNSAFVYQQSMIREPGNDGERFYPPSNFIPTKQGVSQKQTHGPSVSDLVPDKGGTLLSSGVGQTKGYSTVPQSPNIFNNPQRTQYRGTDNRTRGGSVKYGAQTRDHVDFHFTEGCGSTSPISIADSFDSPEGRIDDHVCDVMGLRRPVDRHKIEHNVQSVSTANFRTASDLRSRLLESPCRETEQQTDDFEQLVDEFLAYRAQRGRRPMYEVRNVDPGSKFCATRIKSGFNRVYTDPSCIK